MASYKGGFKINSAALRGFADDAVGRTVRSVRRRALPVVRELAEESVMGWFSQAGFPRSYLSLLHSLNYVTSERQSGGFVSLEFTAFADFGLYDIAHTSLYRQRDKYGVDPFGFIVNDLQWSQGIIGLPEMSSVTSWVNPPEHFHRTVPLRDFVYHKYKWNWKKRLKSYGVIAGNG